MATMPMSDFLTALQKGDTTAIQNYAAPTQTTNTADTSSQAVTALPSAYTFSNMLTKYGDPSQLGTAVPQTAVATEYKNPYTTSSTVTPTSGFTPTTNYNTINSLLQSLQPYTDWNAVVQDPTNPLFGIAIQNNLEGLTADNVKTWLDNTSHNVVKQMSEGIPTQMNVNGNVWTMPINTYNPDLNYKGQNILGVKPLETALNIYAPAADWLTKYGGATSSELLPYFQSYVDASDATRKMQNYSEQANSDLYNTYFGGGSGLNDFGKAVTTTIPIAMQAVSALGTMATGGALSPLSAMMSTAAGNPNASIADILKAAAIGAGTSALGGLANSFLDLGSLGDLAYSATGSDVAGQIVDKATSGLVNNLIKTGVKEGVNAIAPTSVNTGATGATGTGGTARTASTTPSTTSSGAYTIPTGTTTNSLQFYFGDNKVPLLSMIDKEGLISNAKDKDTINMISKLNPYISLNDLYNYFGGTNG